MKTEDFNRKEFNIKQDWYLQELNRLGGLPANTKYDYDRPIITVSHGTYREMEKLANMYVNFILEETPNDMKVRYKADWLFNIIKKYFNEIEEEIK